MNPGFQIIENDLVREIKGRLDRGAIFYRLFNRIKDYNSIEDKVRIKGHYSGEKKIQDVFGIRIITYFIDDVDIIYKYLKSNLSYIDEQIDIPTITEFKPKRRNLVFRLSPYLVEIYNETIKTINFEYKHLLDSTYELQLRTIFSEGWHEIDHSLRYKCKENWKELEEDERLFNSIFASLELSDSILTKLFEGMSYSHFKRSDIESLIRTKFRLKFKNTPVNPLLIEAINDDEHLIKDLFKLDRDIVVLKYLFNQYQFPLNVNNFIYFLNHYWLRCEKIQKLTPTAIKSDL